MSIYHKADGLVDMDGEDDVSRSQEAKARCWARRAFGKEPISQAKLELALHEAHPKSFKRDARLNELSEKDVQSAADDTPLSKKRRSGGLSRNKKRLNAVEAGIWGTYPFAQYKVVDTDARKDTFFGNPIGVGSGHRTFAEGTTTIWQTTHVAADDAGIGETSFSYKIHSGQQTLAFLKVHIPSCR